MTAPVLAVKAALVDRLTALFPQADTAYGLPGTPETAFVAFVGNASVEVTQPTMGGTRRSRDHAIELEVILSAWLAGGPEVQQEASEAVLTMLETLDNDLRTPGHETLDGACRHAWVTRYDLTEDPEDDGQDAGRRADVLATVTAFVRT